jgi:hypothetical protein
LAPVTASARSRPSFSCGTAVSTAPAAQFAVDPQIKKREIARLMRQLQTNANVQIYFSFRGAFCPISFPLFYGTRRSRTEWLGP